MASRPETLTLIGGTGPEGRGLALRLAGLGYRVIIGSRDGERAQQIARGLASRLPAATIDGTANADAAHSGDVVVLTIPFGGVLTAVPPLAGTLIGKIVVSAIAPFGWADGRFHPIDVPEGSAAQAVAALLPRSRVVSAFQTIDSHQLLDLAAPLDTDVVVCSDDADARHRIMDLAAELPGVRALSGGRLAASHYVEQVTGLLITENRIYKAHTGIRLTGLVR